MRPHGSRSGRVSLPVMVVGALLVAATAAVVATQMSQPVEAHVTARVVAMRDLRFGDRADGGVEVRNAADGAVVAVLAPESNNFIRALMRGLVRQRLRENEGPEKPFRLTAWSDGGLTLDDPATGRSVELGAFGPTNAEAFVQLLPLKAIAQ